MSDSKPLITPQMIEEWEEIRKDNLKMIDWQHACRRSEPDLFLAYWDRTVRALTHVVLRDCPAQIAPLVYPGMTRTFGQVAETCMLMGYFFGRRRWESTLRDLDPNLGDQVKIDPDPRGPDDGGFKPTDFSL